MSAAGFILGGTAREGAWLARSLAAPARSHAATGAVVCAMLCCAVGAARAQPADSAAPPAESSASSADAAGLAAPFQFRRVFAPADRVADWPLDAERYMPIEAAEFERLARMLQGGGQASKLSAAQLIAARYEARIGDDDVLAGRFVWQIAHHADQTALLSLDPCGFAIDAAEWRAEKPRDAVAPTAGPRDNRVVLGSGPDGRLGLIVDRAGDVSGSWAQRGTRTAGGSMSFAIDLPPATCSRLICDLPEKMTAVVDHGVAYELPDAAPRGYRRWSVDVGGETRIRFRALAEGAAQERRRLTLLRETLTYELSKRGIDLAAALRLDIHNEPLKRVFVRLDPGLQVLAARIGETAVPWSLAASGADGGARVVFDLPEPVMGSGRVLRISAEAPLPLGVKRRLPGLHPEDMFWQEGTAQLVAPRPLAVEHLALAGCRQTGVIPSAGSTPGETIELQFYGADASVEVMIDQPERPLGVDCGTLVELSAAEMTAQAVAHLKLSAGERFEVRAEIGRQWLIDAVESDADNVSDWSIAPLGEQSRELVVRLKRAVSPQRHVTLNLRGHRATTIGEKLSGAELTMARFRGSDGAQLLTVHASENYDLHTSQADEVTQREAAKIEIAKLEVFPAPPTGPVFVVDDALARMQAWLTNRRPSYSVEIAIDAAVEDKLLRETTVIRCSPQESRVDHLLVRFSQARKQSPHWSLPGGAAGQITAHKVPEGKDSQRPPGGETWEVRLRLPRPGPFELRAARSSPAASGVALSLVSLPEAAAQVGSISVRALGETPLSIHNRRLEPVPPELMAADHSQTARGSFRYEPSRDVAAAEPAITISRDASGRQDAGAWAWRCSLDSRYAVNAAASHLAVLQVQTAGRRALRCDLPAGATLHGAWIDERQVPASAVDDRGAGLRLDLPPGRAFACVVLHYSTRDALPLLTCVVRAPLPVFDIPVLDQRWVAWTPPGHSLLDGDPSWQGETTRAVTWRERLFGPLGRPAREPVFDPIAAEAWRRWAGKFQPDGVRASGLERLFAAIASLGAIQRDEAGEELTWQELLARWKDGDTASGLTLLVDASSLALLGVGPDSTAAPPAGSPAESALGSPAVVAAGSNTDSTIRSPAGSPEGGAYDPDDLARGLALLDSANLMLLSHDDKALLTTAVGAAGCRDQWRSPPGIVACGLASGPLADELAAAAEGKSRRFVSLDAWAAGAAVESLPWSTPQALCEDLTGSRGWSAWTMRLPEGEAPSARLVRTAGMQMCGWALCLAILACGALFRARRPAPWVVAAGLLAALAMLVPPAWTLILAPALLGVLAYLALLVTGRLALLMRPAAADTLATANRPQSLAGIALALAAGAWVATAWAAEGSSGSRAEGGVSTGARSGASSGGDSPAKNDPEAAGKNGQPPAHVHTVFVPVDDSRRPVVGKYYSIPERLYGEMFAAAAAATDRPGAWLLANADYRGVLARDSALRRLALSELRGHFDLRVFEPNATVHLNIDHDSAAFEPGGLRLDGEPVDVAWNAARGALEFQVADPGQYRLEVNLLPKAPTRAGGMEVAVPPLAMARFELAAPADVPSIEVSSARGRVTFSREQGLVSGQLGPTARLAARWREADGADGAASNFDVEELYWLNVRPGSLTLDARIRVRVNEGRVRQIRLRADPRLQPLPGGSESTLIAETHVSAGDPQIFDIELSRPVAEQATIDLRFLVTGASGVGNIRFPRLEVAGARSTRRWAALSVDPALAYEEQPDAEARPLAVPDFSTAWGPSESPLSAAFSLPRGDASLVIATRPREARATVEQTLSLGVSQGRITVLYEATSQSLTASNNFQLLLEGPPGLRVERVAMYEDGLQRVARWSQDPAGQITVFLNGQLSGSEQIELRGVMAAPSDGSLPLPMIRMPATELKKSRVCIYRSPTMLVELREPRDMARENDEDLPASAELGSPVESYIVRGPEGRAVLKLRPNAPLTRGTLTTLVQRENESWIAEADLRLEVTKGLVDAIRLDIPPQWNEPFQLDPPLPHDLVTLAGEKKRQLRIRPAAAIKDRFKLRVRGRLGLVGAERLRAPDIGAPWIGRLARYVVLPTQLELQQVEWEKIGLRSVDLPPELAGRLPAVQAVAAYQVVGDDFQAVLKSVQRMAGAPQVRLADIHLVWLPDGECYGAAAFDIEPAGVGGCVLEAPEHSRLLAATVGGVPAPLEPAGLNRWRVEFVSRQLPQQIEVIFRGRVAAGSMESGGIRLEAPSVADWAVERTLWTVHAPASLAAAQVIGGPTAQSPAQAELWRMKSAAALLDVAPEVADDQRPDEISRWFRPWQKQIERSGELIRREQFMQGLRKTADQEAEARAIQRDQADVARRLGAAPVATRGQSSVASRPTELIAALCEGDRPTLFMAPGPLPANSVSLRYSQSAARDGGLRILAAIAMTAAGVAGVWLLSRIQWRTISAASGLLALGLLWWLALDPSPLGLALVVAGGVWRARRWWNGAAKPSGGI